MTARCRTTLAAIAFLLLFAVYVWPAPYRYETNLNRPIRRIVTGFDNQGRSRIVADGSLPARRVGDGQGYRVTSVWATEAAPAPVDGPDIVGSLDGTLVPKSGTVLRILDIPPQRAGPRERVRAMLARLRNVFRREERHPNVDQPGMHTTTTVDYAIVLSGELVAILDQGETVMRAGDVLIQRGTHHAWSNRSGRPARIAFVAVDGKIPAK